MPNQPKTPNRSIRIDPEAWRKAEANAREVFSSAAEAVRAFVKSMGNVKYLEAHVAAVEAAFPGLPEGMTMEEADRRIAAALDAAMPILRAEWALDIRDRVAEVSNTARIHGSEGAVSVVVRVDDLRRILAV